MTAPTLTTIDVDAPAIAEAALTECDGSVPAALAKLQNAIGECEQIRALAPLIDNPGLERMFQEQQWAYHDALAVLLLSEITDAEIEGAASAIGGSP